MCEDQRCSAPRQTPSSAAQPPLSFVHAHRVSPLPKPPCTRSQNEAVDDKGTNIKCTFFLESRAKEGHLTIDAFVNDALEVYKMQQITKVDLSRWASARSDVTPLQLHVCSA